MAIGVNKVILIGHLGQDPDVRYTQAGSAVANLSIATSESWTDKQSGQRQEKTEWHRIVLFGHSAEFARQYMKKGSKAYVEGKLQTRKWQDSDTGQDRYTTEVIVNGVNTVFRSLDSRQDNQQAPAQQSQQQQPQRHQQRPQQQNQQARNGGQPMQQGYDEFDQNIAF